MIVDASGTNGVKWRRAVSKAASQAVWTSGWVVTDRPIRLYLEFHLERPKSHYDKRGLKQDAPHYHTKRPDATKLLRSVEDSCTGIVWSDDAQVVRQEVRKSYVTGAPGVHVTVQILEPVETQVLTPRHVVD